MVAPPSEAHCAIDGLGGERGDGEWEGDREEGELGLLCGLC